MTKPPKTDTANTTAAATAEKRAAQRRVIIESAHEKFRQFGTRRVTMDELARDLHISKKTLYEHFSSKEELVSACIDRVLNEIGGKVEQAIRADADVVERFTRILKAISTIPRFVSAEFIGSLKSEFPHLWERIDERRHLMLRHFESLFKEGVESGQIWPQINPKVAVRMHLAIVENVIVPEVLSLGEFGPAQLVETIITVLCKGVFVETPDLAQIWDA